jgi:Domain of unknown function (DUF4112)
LAFDIVAARRAIVAPGTNIRFGLDALIGLVPGISDAISTLLFTPHRPRRAERKSRTTYRQGAYERLCVGAWDENDQRLGAGASRNITMSVT